MHSNPIKKIALLCSVLAVLSFGGVYATWALLKTPIDPVTENFNATFVEFTWKPEDILPDNSNIGKNHLQLIYMITTDSTESLNEKNSALADAIQQRIDENKNTIGSMGVLQGYNMKHYFTTDATRALEFVIEFASETEYYVYTFTDEDLETANAERIWISAFKTKLVQVNGIWETANSEEGKALTMYYDSNKGKRSLSINVTTWEKGKLIS